MMVFENIVFGFRKKGFVRVEIEREVRYIVEEFYIDYLFYRKLGMFSGGE